MAFCSFVKVRLTRLNPSLSLLPFFVKIFLLSLSLSFILFLIRQPQKRGGKKKERSNGRRKKGGGRRQHGSRGERTKEIIRVDELGTPRTTVRRQVFFQRHTFQLSFDRQSCYKWSANLDIFFTRMKEEKILLSNIFAPLDG